MKKRIVTFSKVFPVTHPRKGESTQFIEAILTQLGIDYTSHDYFMWLCENNTGIGIQFLHDFHLNLSENIPPKSHTIRSNKVPFEAGQFISAHVWAGKPYKKTPEGYWKVKFAPDFEVKSVTNVDIEISKHSIYVLKPKPEKRNEWFMLSTGKVAENDGLSYRDFKDWFKVHPKNKTKNKFKGQIVCWNENIIY